MIQATVAAAVCQIALTCQNTVVEAMSLYMVRRTSSEL